VLLFGAALGLSFFGYYYAAGLTTAHYDAKAHLVVARRLVDSVEPGYSQMGVHWLPLVHLLYLPFVVFDAQYRTAILPSMISVSCYAASGWFAYRIGLRVAGSVQAGVFAALLILANPNLLYLQSCPLTEPLSMALMLGALDGLLKWRDSKGVGLPWSAAILTALGGLSRYEGWLFTAGVVLLLAWDFARGEILRRRVVKAAALIAALFSVPLVLHFGYLYTTVGDSFLHRVARGNPAPYETFRRPFLSLLYHSAEVFQIATAIPLLVGLSGVAYCLASRERKRWMPLFLLWTPSIINVAAFYWGLIYRVRYSVLLVPALALFGSLLLRSQRSVRHVLTLAAVTAMVLPWLVWYFPDEWRFQWYLPGPGVFWLPALALFVFMLGAVTGRRAVPLLAIGILGMHLPVLQGEYLPILPETLEHDYIEGERRQLLQFLARHYDGTGILIDMGRHAPLIYDSALPISEFLYNEGQRTLWHRAIEEPHRAAGWMCVEKGDELWNALEIDPSRADGYALAVKTDNLVLYRLRAEEREALRPARRIE
jgi:hypothetical protein